MNDFHQNNTGSPTPRGLTEAEAVARIKTWDTFDEPYRAKLCASVEMSFAIQAAVVAPDHGPILFSVEALNHTLWEKAPAFFGIHSRYDFNSLIRNLRTVATHLGLLAPKPPMTPACKALYDALRSTERKKSLRSFMDFLSLYVIDPATVDQATLNLFETWMWSNDLRKDIGKVVRAIASGWNWARDHIPDWPQVTLSRANMRDHYTLPIDLYPVEFQTDVKNLLTKRAADPRKDMFKEGADLRIFAEAPASPRSYPRQARPSTIANLEHRILAAAAALHLSGVPLDQFTSLRILVYPIENARKIAEFHHERRLKHEAGERFETRPSGLIGILETLRQIAKFHCGLPDAHVEQIRSWKAAATPRSQGAMTQKNRERTRALLQPENYARMLHLPRLLEKRARLIWDKAIAEARAANPAAVVAPPKEAVRLMMYAVALEILLFCPLRRHNIVTLDMSEDLIRSGPQRRVVRLIIGGGKTKTGDTYEWDVADSVADIIARWERDYRPVIAAPGNPYLFPGTEQGKGQGMQPRNESEFGNYLGELVEREIGCEFNMHVARHFAVARYLRAHPGQYAVVSRLLGHKSIQTTINFYSDLEANAAAKVFNRDVLFERDRTKPLADALTKKRRFRGKKRGGA